MQGKLTKSVDAQGMVLQKGAALDILSAEEAKGLAEELSPAFAAWSKTHEAEQIQCCRISGTPFIVWMKKGLIQVLPS